jgi:molybdate transport system substrate-binding protein
MSSPLPPITGISSMATRQLLAELSSEFTRQSGVPVQFESVGGVDAARRVQAGEAFDLVVLASDALEKLIASDAVDGSTRRDLVHSGVAVAVRQGDPHPALQSEQAVREAVLAAPTIGYSTGPSGVALVRLFERWGILPQIQGRLLQASPGIPVGSLVAQGKVALGFQQLSELIHEPGIEVVGPLPASIQITTTFSAALGTHATQAAAARALLDHLSSAQSAEVKRRQGMEPV